MGSLRTVMRGQQTLKGPKGIEKVSVGCSKTVTTALSVQVRLWTALAIPEQTKE